MASTLNGTVDVVQEIALGGPLGFVVDGQPFISPVICDNIA
jgi:hypothetical protein